MIPSTTALSSASAPQISFAQVIDSGPYATEILDAKNENHFRPAGIVQMASNSDVKNPKKVEIDITAGLERK